MPGFKRRRSVSGTWDLEAAERMNFALWSVPVGRRSFHSTQPYLCVAGVVPRRNGSRSAGCRAPYRLSLVCGSIPDRRRTPYVAARGIACELSLSKTTTTTDLR